MSGLTIGWEYLTGYAVATDPASRERAEWPPHPARVFMALAAAWFQSGEDSDGGDALCCLEKLGDPQLILPKLDTVSERSLVTIVVPPNYDRSGQIELWWKKSGKLRFAATRRDGTLGRKPAIRTVPRTYVGDNPCFMHWPNAEVSHQCSEALDALCGKVTRIGHSSSLVRMWVDMDGSHNQTDNRCFVVDDVHAQFHARRISEGFLTTLAENYGERPRQRKVQLEEQLEAFQAERKSIKGKGATQRKADIDQQMAPLKDELDALVARAPVRPKVGLWSGYCSPDQSNPQADVKHTLFDTDLLVLTRTAGPDLPLVSTLAATTALRGAIMQHSGAQPVPPWVSGHQPDGQPSQSASGHLACIPLPFVGHMHADGHLLGMGLIFPRSVDRHDRGRVLGPVLLESTGEPRSVELTLGRLGVWTLHKSDWSERRTGLQPSTWTAHPDGATTWASVTPVVLDKFPKADRIRDRRAWRDEVADIISAACIRIGLPAPQSVDVDTTSWHRGSPRAIAKHRRLRGQSTPNAHTGAALGDGFPCYPAKGTRAARPQVHVWLHFSEPVVGPILLGAGRFLGYGLCKPWKENQL